PARVARPGAHVPGLEPLSDALRARELPARRPGADAGAARHASRARTLRGPARARARDAGGGRPRGSRAGRRPSSLARRTAAARDRSGTRRRAASAAPRRADGGDVAGWPPDRLAARGMALVPQGRRVFPSLSVRENLEVARGGNGRWTLERVYELFPRLRERAANRANKLSGGEQQMLAIGRALM